MFVYDLCRALAWIFLRLVYRIKARGMENVPSDGAVIICCNHIHVADPVVMAISLKRRIIFMAKADLYQKRFGKWLFESLGCIPVHRDGNDLYSIKKALGVLKGGGVLGIFPEGTREKNGVHGVFKPGVATFAQRTDSVLVPAFIRGTYKPFSKIELIFGEPLDISGYRGRKMSPEEYQALAEDVIAPAVYSLEERL
ncbi:MAG: 1-acyl-sn-glycerol-3-phosphate acyltransferase [Eubacteriales bacterium]|nr:1-acyl-sn-glycerol-3-phosphate acyltransferase [Eubacteriales bacterium]